MNYVNLFKRGRWLSKSNSLLADRTKLKATLALLPAYLGKEGLQTVKGKLTLLSHYLMDVVHGYYRDYSLTALTLAVAAVLYVVSPLDIIPDFIPAGLVDDVAIVTWAMAKINDELLRYQQWEEQQNDANADRA